MIIFLETDYLLIFEIILAVGPPFGALFYDVSGKAAPFLILAVLIALLLGKYNQKNYLVSFYSYVEMEKIVLMQYRKKVYVVNVLILIGIVS